MTTLTYAGTQFQIEDWQAIEVAAILAAFNHEGDGRWLPLPVSDPTGAVNLWIGGGQPLFTRHDGADHHNRAAAAFTQLADDARAAAGA